MSINTLPSTVTTSPRLEGDAVTAEMLQRVETDAALEFYASDQRLLANSWQNLYVQSDGSASLITRDWIALSGEEKRRSERSVASGEETSDNQPISKIERKLDMDLVVEGVIGSRGILWRKRQIELAPSELDKTRNGDRIVLRAPAGEILTTRALRQRSRFHRRAAAAGQFASHRLVSLPTALYNGLYGAKDGEKAKA